MTLQVETAEAIAAALYRLPFAEFLGEHDIPAQQDVEPGRAMWFHIGEKPKDMRVTIFRPDRREAVEIKAEWRNHHADARHPLKGEQVFRISTYAATKDMLLGPTTDVMVKILGIYKDVLAETGVAGKIADLAPESDSEGTEED